MEINISTVISKVIQLLLILVIGVYTRKRGFIGRDTVKSLSQFLSNVTSPLLIMCSFQGQAYSSDLLHKGIAIIIGSAVIHVLSAVLSYFVFKPKKGSCENAVYEFNTIFANCAFMGFPILQALYGDVGVVYGAFYNTMFHFLFWTYGIVILTRHKKDSSEKSRLDIKKLVFNPGVLMTVVGFVLFIAKIKIPEVVLGGLDMVGDSTFPLAMIIIGALIVELDFKTIFNDLKLYICSFLKLILIPAAVLGACILFGADSTVTYVLVILSGMPAATFGAIFSELYDVNPVTAAKIVCVTTILSVGTIPLLLYFTKLLI